MALTPEQIKELKQQLSSQIQSLPESQRKAAQSQIDSLSGDALEEMIKQQQEKSYPDNQKTIFRMIIDKEVDSVKIGENESAIAVLEINPISQGHTILIPKEAVNESKNLPAEIFGLAKKIADKLMQGLNAKSIETQTETKFGEKIVNLIPIYDSPLNLQSPRKKSDKKELEEISKKLEPKPKKEVIKIDKEKDKKEPIIQRRRIP